MRLVRIEHAKTRGGRNFRKGDIAFTDLLAGVEGRPDNYSLMLVHVAGGYSAPRHRHNFEQVRIMLEGSFGFGPGQTQGPGSIGYFCEGTHYTQDGTGTSTTLLLQIGGPSGGGYMSPRQLYEAIDVLQTKGTLRDGVFTSLDDKGGKHNQDSYEAAWELCHGSKIRYPVPQYSAPVLLEPGRFAWVSVRNQPGVSLRRLARFNERGLDLSMLRIEAGATCVLEAATQEYLLFCASGRGSVEAGAWEARSSIQLPRGECSTLTASEAAEFYLIGVPVFD